MSLCYKKKGETYACNDVLQCFTADVRADIPSGEDITGVKDFLNLFKSAALCLGKPT